jgi:hypothetical protein
MKLHLCNSPFLRNARTCALLLVVLCCGDLCWGQAGSETSTRVCFFNAVTSDKRLFVTWNGVEASPEGIPRGQSFGPFGVPAVTTRASFKVEGYEEVEVSVDLQADTRRAFVVYAGAAEKSPDGTSEVRPLKVFSLPPVVEAAAGKQLEWPMVLVGAVPSAEVTVNGKALALTRNKSVLVAKGQRFVEVKRGEKELLAVSVEGPEDYVLVLFGDAPDALSGGIVYR